jgi:hypothetical protein
MREENILNFGLTINYSLLFEVVGAHASELETVVIF